MNRLIQAVLFDLGDTLMFSPAPWPSIFERAGRALSEMLSSNGVKIDADTFHQDFLDQLGRYYADRDRNLIETTTLAVLQELLSTKKQTDYSETLLRSALNEFYAVTQQNWQLEQDAALTLSMLQKAGFRLGMISNAGDDWDVQNQVINFGIRPFFDFVLTSASCGYRKPHPHIFSLALSKWGYMPDEIAMVGDRLDADIAGARPLGIYTIWIKRRASKLHSNTVIPDVIVDSLVEIPDILKLA